MEDESDSDASHKRSSRNNLKENGKETDRTAEDQIQTMVQLRLPSMLGGAEENNVVMKTKRLTPY